MPVGMIRIPYLQYVHYSGIDDRLHNVAER